MIHPLVRRVLSDIHCMAVNNVRRMIKEDHRRLRAFVMRMSGMIAGPHDSFTSVSLNWMSVFILLCIGGGLRPTLYAQLEDTSGHATDERIPVASAPHALLNESPRGSAKVSQPPGLIDEVYLPVGIDLPPYSPATVRTMRLQKPPHWLGPFRAIQLDERESVRPSVVEVADLPGTWSLTHSGEAVWRLTIRASGAVAIEVCFESFEADGSVWIYAPSGDAIDGPYSSHGPRGNGEFWSAPILGETVTIEYVPRRAVFDEHRPSFRIPGIAHHIGTGMIKAQRPLVTPRHAEIPPLGQRSAADFKDATCSREWLNRRHEGVLFSTVAQLTIHREVEGSFACTGFLVNGLRDRHGRELPHYYTALLTSGHCVEDQEQATHTTFRWGYQTTSCDGEAPSLASLDSIRGARLWSRRLRKTRLNAFDDYALLLLVTDELKSLDTPISLSGWTSRDVSRGMDVFTLGHPSPSPIVGPRPLCLAIGDVDDPDEGGIWPSNSPSFGVRSDYGRTAGGASGSPVFLRSTGQVIGVFGGTSAGLFQRTEWWAHKMHSIIGHIRPFSEIDSMTHRRVMRILDRVFEFTFFWSDAVQNWFLDNGRSVSTGDRIEKSGVVFEIDVGGESPRIRPVSEVGGQLALGVPKRFLLSSVDMGRLQNGSQAFVLDVPYEVTTLTLDVKMDNDADRVQIFVNPAFNIRRTYEAEWESSDPDGPDNSVVIRAGGNSVLVPRRYYVSLIVDNATAGIPATEGTITATVEGAPVGALGSSYTNSIGMEFALIPAGQFDMGSNGEEADPWEAPVTRVRISRSFYMGRHEVTQGQWHSVMGSLPPYNSTDCGPDCPVEAVSWADTQEFVRRLNAEQGENRYRLPTEAEWEYAARAGTVGDRYATDLEGIAWYRDNSDGSKHAVGRKQANAYGLHDMLGNVGEWVQDRAGPYSGVDLTDPMGPDEGPYRRYRGCSWHDYADFCRVSYRGSDVPGFYGGHLGFRIAKTVAVGAAGESPLATADDHGNQPSGATRLALGRSVQGRIESADDEDYFSLEVGQRTAVVVHTSGTLDTVGTVLDSSSGRGCPCTVVASNDDHQDGPGLNFLIEATLDPGTYYVRVESYGRNVGSYTLHVDESGESGLPTSLTNSIGMELALVPAGEFDMGSAVDSSTQPITRVRISRPFYLGKNEVTQEQWESLMGSNPSQFANCGPDCPVENVSWNDVKEFVARLNAAEGGTQYRLPTEAEWEYAATAGGTEDHHLSDLDAIAWYRGNLGYSQQPVGLKEANAFGLHDIIGNVREWVQDWMAPYEGGTVTDPVGPSAGSERVIRGCSWVDPANYCRKVSGRGGRYPSSRGFVLGFRLAMTVENSGEGNGE